MIGLISSRSQSFAVLLAVAWVFTSGLCPWNSNSALAQTSNTIHATQGHHETHNTHHATRGVEHSCSESIPILEEELNWEKEDLKPPSHNRSPMSVIAQSRFYQPACLSLRLLQARGFPQGFSSLYRINLSLRL